MNVGNKCRNCDGKGFIPTSTMMSDYVKDTCRDCKGSGFLYAGNPSVPTFLAVIWCGLKVRQTGEILDISIAKNTVSHYTNRNRGTPAGCLTLNETQYIYVEGSEPGFWVGFINYPRFPSNPDDIKFHALTLAEELRLACHQLKVTVVFPDETVMLGKD